jgi:hypothetical protein
MMVYQIAKWDTTFETADSRRFKTLTWISLPVGFNSNGYREMILEFGDEAPAIYGAWCALLSVAAQTVVRGTLFSNTGPYTTARIAFETRMPEEVFKKLLDWATKKEVGWVDLITPEKATQSLNDSHPAKDWATRTKPEPVPEPNINYPRYSSKGSSSAPTPTPDTRAGDIKRFTVSRLSPIAERIFTRINYRGNAGKNLWKIAALVEAAEVTEAEIYEACLGAKENAKDPPAHLYASLRNKLRLRPDPVELSRLIKSVVVVPKCPQCFPPEIYE